MTPALRDPSQVKEMLLGVREVNRMLVGGDTTGLAAGEKQDRETINSTVEKTLAEPAKIWQTFTEMLIYVMSNNPNKCN